MATSDGISEEDWSKVELLAEEIVDVSAQDADSKFLENKLLLFLGELEAKYGRLPSIVATEADYVNDRSMELRLLKEAYSASIEVGDSKNIAYISSSLAEFYLENTNEKDKAVFWISIFSESLSEYNDSYLTSLLEELKIETNNE